MVHDKLAKAAFYLDSVSKVMFMKALSDALKKDEKAFWVGTRTFRILITKEDAAFLKDNIPLSQAEKKLQLEAENVVRQSKGQ